MASLYLFFAGCKNCANVAPDVFGIEEDFGRARVYNQCGNPELVQQAIDSWWVIHIIDSIFEAWKCFSLDDQSDFAFDLYRSIYESW